jgi:dTMP kinase
MLHHIFLKNGINALLTKEPGGTLVGDKIRKILLERESEGLGYKAELLLFAASRAENVRINIRPALEKGLIVISDRYFDSTTAYQGFGRGINMDIIEYLNKFAVEEVIPDAEVGLKRATAFGKGTELRFEDEFLQKKEVNGKLFLNRVRDGYYQIAKQNPERIKIIDTNRDISLVLNDIIKVLATRLSKKLNKELILEL